MIADWTQVSRNPVAPEVHAHIKQALKERCKGATFDDMDFLRSQIQGRTVLDIGVVEHDLGHIQSPDWKHGRIREWASQTLGVDILEQEVRYLQERGFNVVHVDATSEVDLGSRFERVVIGDVIEHVDTPVNLLRFAARHLEPGGLMILRTPNPYFYRYVWRVLREDTLIANAEHVAWISPCMALEIGRRAGLDLDQYWLIQPFGSNPLKRFVNSLRNLAFRNSDLFTAAFIYVYRKPLSE